MSFDSYSITWFNSWLNNASVLIPITVLGALLLDQLLGEPRRWHPLVGFGNVANWLEKHTNLAWPAGASNTIGGRAFGLLAWLGLLIPSVLISYFFTHQPYGWLADCLLLYFAIGANSLKQHSLPIYHALASKDLAAARSAVAMIVSRDTQRLDETEIATATVESILENGNDAVFGAIFWFLVFGGAGAVLFRLANTLDAMWGYRTPRFIYFGWAAARIDDILNLIPARLTALSYAICGATKQSLQCWSRQASSWYSPNAGPVMAAGAGALNVKLGGAAPYHGQIKLRPPLGMGKQVEAAHILAANRLVEHSILLWCGVIVTASLVLQLTGAWFA